MIIYLDTNVYCRPFDNQLQERIKWEADAFVTITIQVKEQSVKCLSSDILRLEVELIKNPGKKSEVKKYIQICSGHIEETEQIAVLAEEMATKCKLRGRDALHLASALLAHADYFITCDDELQQKSRGINRFAHTHLGYGMKLGNPIRFVLELETERGDRNDT